MSAESEWGPISTGFLPGITIGVIAVIVDAWITLWVFGFQYPYLVIAIAALALGALIKASTGEERRWVLMTGMGIAVGVVVTNYLRVTFSGQPSILPGVGL